MQSITRQSLASCNDFMCRFRREMHRHPELGFEERDTAKKVADALRSLGIEVHEGVGQTGVVGVLRSGDDDKGIALRADMDALPVKEGSDHAYVSTVNGKMHACGHDGHTAMLLGAARYLTEKRPFNGVVVLLFQANEEHGLGALAMLDDRVFDRFPVDEVYGMHNLPGVAAGTFLTRVGTICASESLFEIDVQARGGHSAMPHRGVDAILVGSEIVQTLQTVVARKMAPGSGCVVSVTEFRTDGRRNVLPGSALLKGDVRARTAGDRVQIEQLMRQIVRGIAVSHDVDIGFSFRNEFIETVNAGSPTMAAIDVARTISAEVDGDTTPMSFSEDFAHFALARPGCLMLIGNGIDGAHGQALHSPGYDFNDALLPIGAAYWSRLVAERLPL